MPADARSRFVPNRHLRRIVIGILRLALALIVQTDEADFLAQSMPAHVPGKTEQVGRQCPAALVEFIKPLHERQEHFLSDIFCRSY